MKIYLDMDGVLCDFLGAVSGLIGRDLKNHDDWASVRDIAWHAVNVQGWSFWRDLKWTEEGRELFSGILEYKIPTILSAAASRPEITQDSIVGKKMWLARELDVRFAEEAIFVQAIDKQLYSKPKHILIDDASTNIEQWNSQGGIGILHNGNAKETLKELDRIMRLL